MIHIHKKSFWLLVLLIPFTSIRSQDKDAQLWASIMLKYDLNDKVQIRLEEELRFFENISRLDKANSELTLIYQLNKQWEAGTYYRLIINRDAEGYHSLKHRIALFTEYKKSFGFTSFKAKPMVQFTWPDFYRSENWQVPVNYLRFETGLSHELRNKKTVLFSDIEFWYSIRTGDPGFIDQYRFTAGLAQNMDRNNRIRIYYRFQQELQVTDPLTSHIIGIGYIHRFR